MNLARRARLIALTAAMALTTMTLSAGAQEISEEHLKAARTAIDAINATDPFDNYLPEAAATLKAQLIQQSPNLVNLINATVDEKALELASRRADLEKESALAYARIFSQEDLQNIATFYNSPTGKKLLSDGPIVTREVLQAAEIWRRGVVRDLSNSVVETLQAAAGTQAPQMPAEEPEGAAPAPVEGATSN
ncbi:DUF2059 domain-containing protein [Chelativorans sp. AA-79]|uniref:DUF2059 domain-containing protein n=1 Tax=Chelativorans sp. AA-79 TaxID=3028735 RepID=UPI0023F7F990|nr:DUF2059 domain-containing protein [Chelativorans sp. AA-79]WEX11568.1 DUF2059 domain-containing protein [Chelativorans sp. AA-79]